MIRCVARVTFFLLAISVVSAQAERGWPTAAERWTAWLKARGFAVDFGQVGDTATPDGKRRTLAGERRGDFTEQPSVVLTLVDIVVLPDVAAAGRFITARQAENRRDGYGPATSPTLRENASGWLQIEERKDDIAADRVWDASIDGKARALVQRGQVCASIYLNVVDRQTLVTNMVLLPGNPAARQEVMRQRNANRDRLRPLAQAEMMAFMNEIAAFEDESVLPVIFLHGIGGGVLSKPGMAINTNFWPLARWENRAELALNSDGTVPTGSTVFAPAVLDDVLKVIEVYGPFLRFLESGGRKLGRDVWHFPYDWRLDNAAHLPALDALVERVRRETGHQKVNLVTHSMGGLIAKAYVHGAGEAKVSKLITIALPFRGGSFVFRGIAEGYDFGNRTVEGLLMKTLLQNWPSGYQIYPRYNFIYDPRAQRWLNAAESHSIRYRGFTNLSDPLVRGAYTETTTPVWSNRPGLVKLANAFHKRLNSPTGPRPPPPGVRHFAIVGYGVPTEIAYHLVDVDQPQPGFGYGINERFVGVDPQFGDGDGKVPLHESADVVPATRKFYIRHVADGGMASAEHTELTWNKTVQTIVEQLITNQEVPPGNYDHRPTLRESVAAVLPGMFLSNRSAVTLRITDRSKGTQLARFQPDGPARIAGANLIALAGAEFAWLPVEGGPYDVEVLGVRTGSFTLRLAAPDGTQAAAFGFPSLPAENGTLGRFSLAPREIAAGRLPMLELTTNGRATRVPPRPVALAEVGAGLAFSGPMPPFSPVDTEAVAAEIGQPDSVTIPVTPAGRPGFSVPDAAAAPTPTNERGGASGEPRIAEFRFVDRSQDKVGPWGQGTPNGSADGWFKLRLSLSTGARLAGIALRSVDATGQPTGHAWDSRNAAMYLLGVERDGRRLNATHVSSLGDMMGDVTLDLFAEDVDVFRNGQRFVVEVDAGTGVPLTKMHTVGELVPVGGTPVSGVPAGDARAARIVSFEFLDTTHDKVGVWGQGTPNGAPDGAMRLRLALPVETEVLGVNVRSADADWQPTQEYWSSRENNVFILGVERDRLRLNPGYAPTLGRLQGDVALDLFAEGAAFFSSGRRFLVEVALGSGAKLNGRLQVGAPSASSSPAADHPPDEAPLPDLPPLPPWSRRAAAVPDKEPPPAGATLGNSAIPASVPGLGPPPGSRLSVPVGGAPVANAIASAGPPATFSVGPVALGINLPPGMGSGRPATTVSPEIAARLREAASLVAQNKPAEARAIYDGVLRQLPEQPDALLGVAGCLMAERQTSAALAYLMRYMVTKPEGENKTRAEKLLQQLRGGK